MSRRFRLTALVIAFALACGPRQGPDQPTPADGPSQAAEPEPYEDVITANAVSDSGLFLVHRVEKKLYYEVPDSLLDRDMLLVSRIAQTPPDMGAFVHAGRKVAEQVVRWERNDERLLLRIVSYGSVAADTLPVYRSVQVNTFSPIIRAFEIETFNPNDSAAVIEATDLFLEDVPAISGLSRDQREEYRVRKLDGSRTYIDYAHSYPLNLDVRHTLTFEAGEPPSRARTGTISMQMHQSMVLLPAEPMRRRLADPRLGWFSVEQIDYGLDEQKAAARRYLRRWRLEPSDPEAYARGALVEPVKPIVYYVDPATPEKWRSWIKKGVEDWQVAFEAAGFKNAIIAKDPPGPEEDADWNPEDVRYSTVRWVTSTTRNAYGPSVADPRSGELIESDIAWFHNHLRSYRNRLLIETGAANPQARSLQLPEPLLGEALRAVIAHEVGHAVGLPHNMIASSAYPVDSLRSPTFTHRMGIAPTIMDYARQNYIAQPGDGDIRFIRQIGPYDEYAINWGYRVIAGADTPEAEKETLDRWIQEHAGDPIYRYAPQRAGLLVDPHTQTEDLGDDPVRASGYAIENLKRVVANLIDWTTRPGEGYDDLEELYGELVFQWNRYIGHVLTQVGGTYEYLKASDQAGPVYQVVPRAKQKQAVAFLHEQIFETPTWLNDPEILRRIEHAGAVERIRRLQVTRLEHLLDPERLQRMIEAELFDPERAYGPLEFLDDVRAGIWSELETGDAIDTYRRNLQRGYLERMAHLMTEEATIRESRFFWQTPVDVSQSDIRPFVRGQLDELRSDIEAAVRRAADRATRHHLQHALARIDDILEGEDDGD